jgi:peptidoglycan/xylan/chitin deacetylase (PgdA/CDA1 family)
VHSGPAAEGAAKAVAGRAFTRGEDVVFGAGHWRPNTAAGQRLLAHELTHVVQHRRDGGSPETIQRAPDPETWVPDSDGSLYYATEAEAERRRAALAVKGEWSEYRVVSFKQGSTTYWRVEMRGEKKGAAPAPGPPAPSAPKEEAPKQPAPSPAPAPSPSAPGPTTPAPTTPAPTTPATGATRVFSLTFDDGPHAAALGTGKNRTEKVLDTLKSKGVKGAFFVQTGVSYRGASSVGKKLMARMAAEGHTVGIHTGGTADHELHTKAEAAGRLESELKAGKAAIAAETGSTPTLVRPPTGASNKAVEATYAKVSLSNLLWDIDGDVGASSLADLKARLDSTDPKAPGIPAVHARGWTGTTPSKPKIVVLYHDVRANTASNIGPVIDHIKAVTAKISGGKDTADFAPP